MQAKDWLSRFDLLRLRRQSAALLLANLFVGVFAAHAQNGPFLYVPTNLRPGVSVVDTSTNSVPFAAIPAGPGIAVAVRGDESAVYVPNDINATVTPVDTAANTLGTPIQLTGGPFVEGLAITPNGKTVYAATVSVEGFPGATGFITPINTATNTAGTPIDVGLNPRGVVASPDGKTIYVANLIVYSLGEGTVTPINTATNTPGTPIPVGPVGSGIQAFSLAITPDGKTLYVANPFGSASGTPSLIAINTATKVATPIPGVAASFGLAVTPNGSTLYVANAFADTVTVINTATNAVITTIPVSGTPNGVAVSPDGRTVYVTNFGTDTVTPINTATNKAGAPIPVVMAPEIFPGIASNGNALLASGLTFVAHTSGALESTLASGPTGSPGPIFTGGTLQFAGPNITSALPIVLEAEGGTFDTLANTATLSGTINGPGALIKIGTGTLILTGDNTYSGGTTINAGTLQLGNGGTTGSITGNVTDNGTLAFNRSNTVIFPGVISGTGSLAQIGPGTTILTAENTYTGGTTISAGTLQLSNGGTTGSIIATTGNIIGNVTDNGILAFNRVGFTLGNVHVVNTFAGVISGTGSVVQLGSDTLVLTANNTYSGGTIIQDGTLVAGVPNAVQATSFALGTGDVFLQGGTLTTPSLDPLIINVGRNYAQGPGGTLALGIGGLDGKDYDHVQVGGNASLNGTLVVSSLNNFHPVAGDAFEVLHTNGRRSGNFAVLNDSLFNNNPNITPSLRPIDIELVAPNGVLLVYLKRTLPTPTPTPPIIDVIPEPLPPVEPEEPVPPSFVLTELDPTAEQLTAMYEIGFSEANTQRFKLDERFDEIQRGSIVSNPPPAPAPITTGKEIAPKQPVAPPPPPENRWGVWANGWGDWVSVSNDGLAKGYDFTTGGFIAGVDYRITDHIAVGLMGGYAHTATSLQPSGDIDVTTGRGGLYATYFDHGFYVNAAGYGGYNSYSTSRQALQGMANGSTNSGEFSIWTEAGYDFHFGDFTMGPMGALQYTLVDVDGFSEQGSLLPLHIQSNQETSLRTDLGARASYTWHLGNVLVIPTLTVAWEHEYLYTDLPITVNSVEFPGQSATLFGPAEGHDGAIINAGAAFELTPRLLTYLGYQGQLGRDHYNANAITGGFSFSF
jgi:outer membrane autotransporter protein